MAASTTFCYSNTVQQDAVVMICIGMGVFSFLALGEERTKRGIVSEFFFALRMW